MRCDVGIAPYIVVAETDNLEKRLIFYIQNKKTHRVSRCVLSLWLWRWGRNE